MAIPKFSPSSYDKKCNEVIAAAIEMAEAEVDVMGVPMPVIVRLRIAVHAYLAMEQRHVG